MKIIWMPPPVKFTGGNKVPAKFTGCKVMEREDVHVIIQATPDSSTR